MTTVHTLAGLPRSGSTLLANVLAQHPDLSVSGTSALATAVESLSITLSTSAEVQSDLANVPGSDERYCEVYRALIRAWYCDADTEFVLDKGRGWAGHRLLLDWIMPNSVTLVTVRDPRDVFASVERQHRNTAQFASPSARGIYESANLMFSPEGIIGAPIRLIEDLIRRNLSSVEFIRYETFVRDPLSILAKLESRLGLDHDGKTFAWDPENVENVATDLDALYLGKYPHVGSGPIKPTGESWVDLLQPELAAEIATVAPLYMQTFGYEA